MAPQHGLKLVIVVRLLSHQNSALQGYIFYIFKNIIANFFFSKINKKPEFYNDWARYTEFLGWKYDGRNGPPVFDYVIQNEVNTKVSLTKTAISKYSTMLINIQMIGVVQLWHVQ